MREIDPGHIYRLWQLGSDEEIEVKFPKRSGGAIQYPEEWPGVQSQEFYRMLIKRTLYLNSIIECNESHSAIWHSRSALWEYEARAWRRKQEKKNRKSPQHDDSERVRPWRQNPANDVPFGLFNIVYNSILEQEEEIWIEDLPIGEDGHISQEMIGKIKFFQN